MLAFGNPGSGKTHLAAAIANKIVAVYQDTRVEEEKDIMNRAITSMNEY